MLSVRRSRDAGIHLERPHERAGQAIAR